MSFLGGGPLTGTPKPTAGPASVVDSVCAIAPRVSCSANSFSPEQRRVDINYDDLRHLTARRTSCWPRVGLG